MSGDAGHRREEGRSRGRLAARLRQARQGRSRGWGPLNPDAEGAVPAAARRPVSSGSMASRDELNSLNDLTRGGWRKFSQSAVFWGGTAPPWLPGMSGGDRRPWAETGHPDSFPDGLPDGMVAFFTKRGGTVLDPFAGTGATLAACDRLGRRGIGIELHEKWANIARERTRQTVVCADAIDAIKIAEKAGVEFGTDSGGGDTGGVDLLLTGVPRPVRETGRLRQYLSAIMYRDDEADVSLAWSYQEYMDEAARRLDTAIRAVCPGGHIVLVQPNEAVARVRSGCESLFIPAAFDMAARVGRMHNVEFVGEKVWVVPPRAGRAGKRRMPDGGGALRGYPHMYTAGVEGVESALYCMVFFKHGWPEADRLGKGESAAKCP